MTRLRLALGLLCLSGAAHAASPTVAVMPFKDLSGSKGSIGEAIRETVTTDLRGVSGLRVIERSNIDRVLAEQNLQAMKSDLDPLATVKVGKLLGATLIVAGAYQKAASTVRLTARFVKVETGEVVGTAKVDGSSDDFLTLQDRVTVQLLKSAGIEQTQVQTFAKRTRPKIKSLKTVELYGDAVVETDDHKKQDFLKLALNEDPTFTYAVRDLDELEQRMKKYEAVASSAQEKSFQELRAKIAAETDADKKNALIVQALGGLQQARRYRTLIAESRKLLAGPLPTGTVGALHVDELAAFYIVTAESQMKERDAVLRDGEAFLKRFPSSMYFKSVEMMMESVISTRRKEEEGKPKAAAELAKLSSQERWDLCRVARVYRYNQQVHEAQRLFRACLEVGSHNRLDTLRDLVSTDVECADWPSARRDLSEMDKLGDKDTAGFKRAMEFSIPVDG